MGDLTKNFSKSEFACKCGNSCNTSGMDRDFIDKLQGARTFFNRPMIINSGIRCQKHNDNCGFSPTSSHLSYCAADIKCSTSAERYKIIECLLMSNFNRIGIGRDFIHVDDDKNKPPNLVWLYR